MHPTGSPPTGVWSMFFNEPGPNQGDFSIDVESAGTAYTGSGVTVWFGAFGTATVTLPASMATPWVSGTATATIQWVNQVSPPDAGPFDAGFDAAVDDAATGSGQCQITYGGPAFTGSETCKVSAVYAGVPGDGGKGGTTTLTIKDTGDAGLGTAITLGVVGPLDNGIYSAAAGDVVLASTSIENGSRKQSFNGADAGASTGTFTADIASVNGKNDTPTGWTYVAVHGSYTAFVPVAGVDGGAPENVTVTF